MRRSCRKSRRIASLKERPAPRLDRELRSDVTTQGGVLIPFLSRPVRISLVSTLSYKKRYSLFQAGVLGGPPDPFAQKPEGGCPAPAGFAGAGFSLVARVGK